MLEEREKFYKKLIEESFSFREVCLKAGIAVTTGNYDTLKRLVERENIDTSHFKRVSHNSVSGLTLDDYLQNKHKIGSFKLKNKLIKAGLKKEICECCGNTEWMGKPIPLQLHHKDGNKNNNNLDNLVMLCPNCHSFTDTWCAKNQKKKIRHCLLCGKEINNNTSLYCSLECKNKAIYKKEKGIYTKDDIIKALNESKTLTEAAGKLERCHSTIKRKIDIYKIDWHEHIDSGISELIEYLLLTKNFSKTGRKFGISDNGVRKRLKAHGYPIDLKELEEAFSK